MSNEIKYVATRTLLSKRFVSAVCIAILGLVFTIVSLILLKSFNVVIIIPLAVFVIATLVALVEALQRRSCTIEFYDNKYVIKSGVIAKQEHQITLTNVISVSVSRTVLGGIFNYGDVKIDIVGKNDAYLSGVKNPNGLKQYIETIIANNNKDSFKQVIAD